MTFLMVLAGLALLWIGSNILVKGALSFSKKVGWSDSFVGLTLLSLCSNLPEVAISVTGAIGQLRGVESSSLVIGNIIGSSLSHITLILGLAGLMKVLKVKKSNLITSGLMLIVSTGLLILFSMDGYISQQEGVFLVLTYLLYLLFVNRSKKNKQSNFSIKRFFAKKTSVDLFQVALGLVVILYASDWVLNNAMSLASTLGISQVIVGIFILGLGNSLPELFVVMQGLRAKLDALSISTIIGSNVVGALLAIGLSASIVGWRVERSVANFDLPFLLLASVVVILFLLTKKQLDRKESLLLLSIYLIYSLLKMMGY